MYIDIRLGPLRNMDNSLSLPVLVFLCLVSGIHLVLAASYVPTDKILLDCGATSNLTDSYGQKWMSDKGFRFPSSSGNSSASPASSQDPAVPRVPYMTARVFRSNFTYTFPLASGRVFLRLHFYPSSYSGLNASDSLFFFTSFSSSCFLIRVSFLFLSMELFKIVNPKSLKLSSKRLFRSKKDRSKVSRSDPSSFGSGVTSSSSCDASVSNGKAGSGGGAGGLGTPTSVLPEISGDWSDILGDMYLELVQAFKLIDKDNDGFVSRGELEAFLSRLGPEPPSRKEVATMLSEVDRDGEGSIRVEALMSRIGSAWEPAGADELKEAFEFFDADRDGKITAEELLQVFTALGDDRCTLEDCRRMAAEVSGNGDGFVCFEDFARMMEPQR